MGRWGWGGGGGGGTKLVIEIMNLCKGICRNGILLYSFFQCSVALFSEVY